MNNNPLWMRVLVTGILLVVAVATLPAAVKQRRLRAESRSLRTMLARTWAP